MRIPTNEHTKHPWRLAEIAPDFELVDAWELPAQGELSDFADLRRVWADTAMQETGAGPVNALFVMRGWLGEKFGWDASLNIEPIPGTTETSLVTRLPPDLQSNNDGEFERPPFRTVYVTDTESAAELSNSMLHAILHLGWARQPDNTYRGHLGVYVKHRGRFGRPYMAFIAPFRHYVVYPALMKRIGRNWAAR
jgi:hypothetical protein